MNRAPKHEIEDLARHTSDQCIEAVDRGAAHFASPDDRFIILSRCLGRLAGRAIGWLSVREGIPLEQARDEIVKMILKVPLAGNGAGGKSPGLDTAQHQEK